MDALFVPIDIAALPVGAEDQEAVSILPNSADFSQLPWVSGGAQVTRGPFLSEQVIAASKPFSGGQPYPAGVHLHWALPYALSRGTQLSPQQPVSFPAVPNRWLVVRVVTAKGASAATPLATMAWIVESDRLNGSVPVQTPMYYPTVPVGPPSADGQTFQYLGQIFPLAGWSETAASRLAPFTAIGPGEISFAAYYPNCCTSFGLLDTLADYPDYDGTQQELAYIVCGWYADAADDPLSGGSGAAAALGWDCGQGDPTQTILCGTIGGVRWSPSGANIAQTSGNALTVTLGPTAPQALSAALAAAAGADDPTLGDAEEALNALQCGLLPQSGDVADALPSLAETLHREGFASAHGGTLWIATPASVSSDAPAAVLSQATAAALAALNQAQAALDASKEARKSRQRQLFSAWNAYQASAHRPAMDPFPAPLSAAQLEALMSPAIAAIEAAVAEEQAQQAVVAAEAAAVGALLLGEGFDLAPTDGAARFWKPLDPAMVLVGDDVAPVTRYTGNASPVCRLASQMAGTAAFAAGAVTGSTAIAVTAGDLGWLPQLAGEAGAADMPATSLQLALGDAVLTSPGFAATVIAAAAAQGGSTNPGVLDAAAALAAYDQSLADFMGSTTGGAVQFGPAIPPDPQAIGSWAAAPWLPILLQYQVSLAPFAAPAVGTQDLPTYAATVLSGGDFALDVYDVDLVYAGAAGSTSSVYQGQVSLSPDAKNNLGTAIAAYIALSGNTDPDLPAVQTSIDDLRQLSQSMAGLTDALLMLNPVLQLPVFDPTMAGTTFLPAVADAVSRENAIGPNFEVSFNPLRAGLLTLQQIRLVDAFGRFMDYQGANLTVDVAAAFAPPAALAGSGLAYLPPRLGQASRLLFNWVDAASQPIDMGSPAASPVFAYLVVNRLNDSLEIYAADGTPTMILALTDDGATAAVSPPPGSPLGTAATFAAITAGLDADLVSFAAAVSDQAGVGAGAYLAALLQATNAGLETVLPARFAENIALAALIGQPLALARATLSLQTKAPPAPNLSWDALVAQSNGQASGIDAGIGEVQVPVMLGAVEQLNDTLVGFFVGGDYDAFHAVAPVTPGSGVTPASLDTITVTPNGAPLAVTLLLDPRGEVNATTGLLPVKTIQLPAATYSAGLAVAFRIGTLPSGSNAGGVTTALPAQSSGTWSWLNATASGGWSSVSPGEAALAAGSLAYTPQSLLEGWLMLGLAADEDQGRDA